MKANNSYDLMDHLQKCHELEQKYCWRCDFQTKDVLCLRKHFDEKHKRFKGLKTCPHCDSTFKTWDHRKIHIESQHKGIRYPCEQCDFKGTQRVHLRIHVENVLALFKKKVICKHIIYLDNSIRSQQYMSCHEFNRDKVYQTFFFFFQ